VLLLLFARVAERVWLHWGMELVRKLEMRTIVKVVCSSV